MSYWHHRAVQVAALVVMVAGAILIVELVAGVIHILTLAQGVTP